MTVPMKWFSLIVLSSCLLCVSASAATRNAASCNAKDVQSAINSASTGDTVAIPAGTCTWTNGVTISGKGITVTGAGSDRIIAISSSQLSLGTGSRTLNVIGADPGSTLSISTGQTLTIRELGTLTNYLTGTVTSYNSGTKSLVMNITSSGGSCGSNRLSNCKRWLVETLPGTVTNIVNSDTGNDGALFNINESTEASVNIGNIKVTPGSTKDNVIAINYTSGGKPVLVHDMHITGNPDLPGPPSGNATMIMVNTNRGVVWNCSFDSAPYNESYLGAISVQNGPSSSWTSPSNMGSLDTTGTGSFYAEDNDYHAMGYTTSTDDEGRAVWRYSLYDNSGVATHGADTSNVGQRFFEFYNNRMVFEGYDDGTTFNINNWFFLRGGTGLIYNNTIDQLQSQDYGTKHDWSATVMNLQRGDGPNPCWGSTNHSTAGQFYHAPRQVGFGYVTGKGTANYPAGGVNNSSTDSVTYVGDSEPFYIWGNSRTLNIDISDYGSGDCSNTDSSSNYIVAGRDFFNNGTSKPGWSPYTYPHPLRTGQAATTTPPPLAPPTNVTATVQ